MGVHFDRIEQLRRIPVPGAFCSRCLTNHEGQRPARPGGKPRHETTIPGPGASCPRCLQATSHSQDSRSERRPGVAERSLRATTGRPSEDNTNQDTGAGRPPQTIALSSGMGVHFDSIEPLCRIPVPGASCHRCLTNLAGERPARPGGKPRHETTIPDRDRGDPLRSRPPSKPYRRISRIRLSA